MTTLSKEDVDLAAEKFDYSGFSDEFRTSADGLHAFAEHIATLARADLVTENERLNELVSTREDDVRCEQNWVRHWHSEAETLRTALAAAIAREIGVMKLMAEVESKYSALLKEQDAESEKFKAEGDMYGWNFHTGLRSGAVQMHLNMTTLIKAIAKPRDDSALREMIAGVYEECAKVLADLDPALYDADGYKQISEGTIRALAEKAKGE